MKRVLVLCTPVCHIKINLYSIPDELAGIIEWIYRHLITTERRHHCEINLHMQQERLMISYKDHVWKPNFYYILNSLHTILCDIISEYCCKKNCLNLHASAVAFGGKNLVIMGDKGAGKTTLMMSFLKHGGSFIGDESIVTDEEKIYPMPFFLHVSPQTLFLLKDSKFLERIPLEDGISLKYKSNDKLFLDPFHIAPNRLSAGVKLDAIIVLEKNQHDSYPPRIINRLEGFKALLSNSRNSKSVLQEHSFNIATKIVAQCRFIKAAQKTKLSELVHKIEYNGVE